MKQRDMKRVRHRNRLKTESHRDTESGREKAAEGPEKREKKEKQTWERDREGQTKQRRHGN